MSKESNGTSNKPVTREALLDLIYERPVEIGHWVGFSDLTDLHNEWLKKFLFNDDDMTLLAHRGSYKSTCLSLFFAINIVIRPTQTVIYFRKTDTNVSEICRQVQKILSTGAFKNIVKTLYDTDLVLTKATGNEINTNLNTSVRGASSLLGLGIGSSVTGVHGDVIVVDDIVTLQDRLSKSERERTKVNYMELRNICNRGGRFINVGTKWHAEDAFTIMPTAEIYDCYSTGLITEEQLKQIKSSMTPALFSANYELKIVADEDQIFKEAHYIEDGEDGEALLSDGQAHIDASYGGSDFTAYTIMRQKDDGRIIAFGKLWQKHVDNCIPEIQHWHKKYKAGSVHIETNGDKGYLASELENQFGFYVNTYHEHMNKFIKIASYLRQHWDNIYWLPNTDKEYISQILDFTENASHDDAPDSAAALLREMMDESYVNTSNVLLGGII